MASAASPSSSSAPAASAIPYGLASRQGVRYRRMEDAAVAILRFLSMGAHLFHFFAVFDGHGGTTVPDICRSRIPAVVVEEAARSRAPPAEETARGWRSWWEGVMERAFKKVEAEVAEMAVNMQLSWTAGSTAAVAVVGSRTVTVANCGNSRVVLYRRGRAIPLSRDHRPYIDRNEYERIHLVGGLPFAWEGHRVPAMLTTSRAIGDYYMSHFVIPDPDVMVVNRTEEDEFLILATDGLWDVLSNELAGNMVRSCLRRETARYLPTQVAANVLIKAAIAGGSLDNISVIVVKLSL